MRNDLNRVKEAIAAGKYVVCSLAPSFIADFRIESISAIEKAIKGLGFSDVQETAIGAQMVSDEYARIMREKKQGVLISSCCPSINQLIQKYYPTMLPYMAKVLSPMQAHCKAIKEQRPDAFTVFIGPCIAKKAEADESPYTDVALTYDELRAWFTKESVELSYEPVQAGDGKRARFYPATGGIL
ncbi:MAG: [Fe-Fe] hydrogenase large subunit C-terminal domain-containing protein, partial [Clostridia bacterium]